MTVYHFNFREAGRKTTAAGKTKMTSYATPRHSINWSFIYAVNKAIT
jgi:hypothetical protein